MATQQPPAQKPRLKAHATVCRATPTHRRCAGRLPSRKAIRHTTAVAMRHAAANMPVMIIVIILRLPAWQPPPAPATVALDAAAIISTASASSHSVAVLVPLHRNWTYVSVTTQFQKICIVCVGALVGLWRGCSGLSRGCA